MNFAKPVTRDCGHHHDDGHLEGLAAHLFKPSGVDGVYGRTGAYESVVESLSVLITRHRPRQAEVFRFPPVMSRASLEKQGYLQSFPNLVGAVACLDAAAELFREQGHGHLIAIASVAGKRGLPATAGYSASKAGLISYMESLELELHRSPIATTLLLPGYIDTPINQDAGPRPFLIDVERGAALIARHIEKRTRSAYVPGWPWALIGRLLPLLPTSLIARAL